VVVAFVLAAVLAGGITFLLYRRLSANGGRHQTTKIVAAAADLPMGATLAAKDIVLVDWPTDVPLTGTFSKADAVLGRPLVQSIGAKEPIFVRDLGIEGSGIGIAAKIPPGMRATAVRSNEIVGVAGFLYPGSHVDVLATYNVPNGTGTITQTVLQDVEVVTAGQTIEPDPQGKPQQVNVVTLLLNPENSQKLQLASTQGSIQFVLRNGTDTKNTDMHPTRLDELAGLAKPAPPTRVFHKTTPPPQQPVVLVEVIEGTKRTVHKF
jgi:pilus assembly protein CpaB